ncbi:hypothetical protein [Micromonospora lupini]|uniref:Uncharacterized protein n=1 Tax=Micromonospora lupini str. Lupac 08 TaxID=1150864 RepID=I0L1Q5_9ACTN|nr:hypothetical protein [Micromonospora lupini]CCH17752.1 hypothetical protein MILUP08_42683 [Micromonospora lupini str. Lupac 08]
MTQRDATGSIRPGFSIPSLTRVLAIDCGLPVDDSLYHNWQAVTDFMCHLDDWFDDNASSAGEVERCAVFLERGGSTEAIASLSPRQRTSLLNLRDCLPTTGVQAERAAQELAGHVRGWAAYTAALRRTTSLRTFLALRRQESRHLAALMTAVVPYSTERRRRLSAALAQITIAAQFIDSVVDLDVDRAEGAVQLRVRHARVTLATVAAWESVKCLRYCPGLFPRLVVKGLLLVKNRNGRWNAHRIHA